MCHVIIFSQEKITISGGFKMPGFKTHYLFGRNTIASIRPNEDEMYLVTHPQAFHLGLQGPDVFFYRALNWIGRKNIGNIIHHENTTAFFMAMIDTRNHMIHKKDRAICDAYISGFIGHYTLDTYVHPYIFWRTKNEDHRAKHDDLYDFGLHVFLETDIDNAILRHYLHMKPTAFAMGDTIALSLREHAVLSVLLYSSIKKAFPNEKVFLFDIRHSLDAMKIEANLMKDPTGFKKKMVRAIERIFFGHAIISGMIPSDTVVKYHDPCNMKHMPWKNPWNKNVPHNESVYELMDKACDDFTRRIHMYSAAISSRKVADASRDKAFINLMTDLGDCSYDSGLPL